MNWENGGTNDLPSPSVAAHAPLAAHPISPSTHAHWRLVVACQLPGRFWANAVGLLDN